MPNVWSRKVTGIRFVENDMGYHTILPLTGEQGFKLLPRTRYIEGGKTEGCDSAVPIPLIGIETSGWHRISTTIVLDQDIASFAVMIGLCIHIIIL